MSSISVPRRHGLFHSVARIAGMPLLALAITASLTMLTGASAYASPVQAQPHPATGSSYPPPVIPIGGGGWYNDTVTGNCGTATIAGNPLSGSAEFQASLYSFQGNITGSPTGVDIDWQNLTNHRGGNFFFYPSLRSPAWNSSIVTANTGAGTVEVVLSGTITTVYGSPCEIDFPVIEFPVG